MTVIEVYPNPYIAIDKDGVPQGVISIPGMPNSHVGARRDLVASRRTGKERFYFPLGRLDRKKGELGPRPMSDGRARVHYGTEIAQSVRLGELIAIDEETAKLCGVSKFIPPAEALAREKEKALAYYRSVKGPDAELQEIPRDPEPEPATGDTEKSTVPAHIAVLTPTVTMDTSGSAPAHTGEE